MEPLRADWEGTRTAATLAAEAGDKETARLEVERFHTKLANIVILDPACGTGNFLYVALARLKELEGEVLELLDRKSVVEGKSVSVRVDLGGRRSSKKKT